MSARGRNRSMTASIVCFWRSASARHRVELVNLAVDARAHETLRAQLLEDLHVLALALAHDRREHHEARVLGSSASTPSTIWLTVCASSGMPWSGQRGVPTRANNRRR